MKIICNNCGMKFRPTHPFFRWYRVTCKHCGYVIDLAENVIVAVLLIMVHAISIGGYFILREYIPMPLLLRLLFMGVFTGVITTPVLKFIMYKL